MANLKDLLTKWSSFTPRDELQEDEYFNAPLNTTLNKNENYSAEDFVPAEDSNPIEEDSVPLEQPVVGRTAAAKYFQNSGIGSMPQEMNQIPTQVTQPQESNYEKYVKILKQLQGDETDRVNNINLIRGSNQIAQAVASGYGAKIGDGQSQLNKLQEAAEKPIKDYQMLLRVIKENQVGAKSPIGFGQFTNKAGEPISMLPDGRIWNNVQNRPHDPTEGVIPRAVDRVVYDADGTPVTYSPGRDNDMSMFQKGRGLTKPTQPQGQTGMVLPNQQSSEVATGDSTAVGGAAAPKNPFEVKQLLSKRDRDVLDKDVDQFQTEVKDALRVKTELANLDPLLKEAKVNPAASKAIGGLIAQLFQGGKLSDSDVGLYVGRYGVVNWLKDTYSKLVNGTHTPEMLDQVKQYIDLYAEAMDKSIPQRAKVKAQTMVERFDPSLGISPEVVQQLYFSDKNIDSGKTSGKTIERKTADGRIAIFDENKQFIKYKE